MRHVFRIKLLASLGPLFTGLLSTAHAQDGTAQGEQVLVFITAFVGAIIFSAYVASKMIRPKRLENNDRIVPVPLPRKR